MLLPIPSARIKQTGSLQVRNRGAFDKWIHLEINCLALLHRRDELAHLDEETKTDKEEKTIQG